jgi:nitrogen fixation NifU-like protein
MAAPAPGRIGFPPQRAGKNTEMNNNENDDLKRFTEQLQKEILERIRQQYSEAVIQRWQNPQNFHRMEHPDGYAKTRGSCGDTMEMFIQVQDNIIRDCSFQTDGCGTTIACGSMATELAKELTFNEALAKVSSQEILKRLGGLPEADMHCAQLAAETLRRAMADYLYQKKEPWKKSYRTD